MEMRRFVLAVTNSRSVVSLAIVLCLELFIAPGFSTQRQMRSPQSSLLVSNTDSNGWKDRGMGIRENSLDQNELGEPLDLRITRSWKLAQTFRPPDRGAPPQTEDLGTRSITSLSNQKLITALMPNIKSEATNFGLTVSEYPTFFGYIPETTAQKGEFILIDEDEHIVYWTDFSMPKQPGIVSVTLPPNALPPLEVNRWYRWYFIAVDNPDGWSNNGTSNTGWIQRIELTETLKEQLNNASPNQLPALYAESGIWHDAVASLLSQRRSEPDNLTLIADWQQLFTSAGLEMFSQDPLMDCCQK